MVYDKYILSFITIKIYPLAPNKINFFFVAKLFTLLEQAVAFADPHSLFNGCYNSKVALIELVIVPRHIN